jgi:hypothetical protein
VTMLDLDDGMGILELTNLNQPAQTNFS